MTDTSKTNTSKTNTSNNPQVTITNNSGVDVDIYDVYNPSGKADQYTYTKLDTLKKGVSKVVQTIHMASELLAVDSGDITLAKVKFHEEMFPVAVFSASALDTPPLKWSMTADDYTGAKQSFLFAKYSNANPDSKIVKTFNAALKKATDDKGKAVDAFFKGTANFPKATYVSWIQIINWQTQSLSPWQGTYYLYNVPKADEKLELLCVVAITKDGSGTVYVADSNGNYQGNQHSTIEQSGDGHIVTSGDMSLNLSVRPIWSNIRSVSSKGAVRYGIGGALIGTFNGTQVSGSGRKYDLSSIGNGSSNTLDNYLKWQAAVGGMFGNLVSFAMLVIMFKEFQMKKKDAKDKVVNDAKDPESNRDKIKEEQQKAEDEVKAEEEPKIEAQEQTEQADSSQLPEQRREVDDAQDRIEIGDAVDSARDKVDDLLREVPPSDAIEEAIGKAVEARNDARDGDMEAAFEDISSASEIINKEAQSAESSFNEQEKEASEDIAKEIEEERQREADAEKAKEELEKEHDQDPDSDIKDDRFDPPEEGEGGIGE